MKDSKISLLLLVSLSMLLLALAVLFAWGVTYYKQNIRAAQLTTLKVKDTAATKPATIDSLQKIYTSTIYQLNTQLDSTRQNVDSLEVNMLAKLAEYKVLKNDIAAVLQNNPTSSPDLLLAKQKMLELQKRLDEWRKKYADVAEENNRLSQLLLTLSKNANNLQAVNTQPLSGSKPTVEKPNSAPFIIVSDIHLIATMQLEDREQETYQALQTDELKGSFELRSNMLSLNAAEMYVVVLQPDGKVLKQSSWESGLFETGEGRKIYSCKMKFDVTKGESKRLSFIIAADQYQKGNYVLQLYHNGKMIGRTTKSLS